MEELLAAIERQISAYKLLDDDKQEQPDDSSATASSSFVSLIRLNGKPIPPPVVSYFCKGGVSCLSCQHS